MSAAARLTDIGVGTCCDSSHNGCVSMTGFIISSANTVIAEEIPVARCGDIVMGNCGHIGIIITCSNTVIAENSGLARIGDQFVGTFSGTIVSGAISVDVGD